MVTEHVYAFKSNDWPSEEQSSACRHCHARDGPERSAVVTHGSMNVVCKAGTIVHSRTAVDLGKTSSVACSSAPDDSVISTQTTKGRGSATLGRVPTHIFHAAPFTVLYKGFTGAKVEIRRATINTRGLASFSSLISLKPPSPLPGTTARHRYQRGPSTYCLGYSASQLIKHMRRARYNTFGRDSKHTGSTISL